MLSPERVLSAVELETISFRTGHPGYVYGDVDTFFFAAQQTITWLEEVNQQLVDELGYARGLADDLQNRVATLTHTIEIFRVRGDVIATPGGEVLTRDWMAHIESLNTRIVELESALTQHQAG